jgi:helix-turn-helix protein
VPSSRFMTEVETAAYLDTTPGTLRTWRYRRTGPPFVKIVNRVKYDRVAIDRWLDSNTVQPEARPA